MKKLILFLLIFFIGSQALAEELRQPKLILQKNNGTIFDLKNKKGQIVIINFWVSWCGNCKREMATLKALKNKHKNLELIGISVDRKKDYDDFLKVAKDLNYPNFTIYEAKVNDFGEPNFLPSTYIVDKKGDAKQVEDNLEELVEKYL